jgi:hypothetical protein
MCTQCEDENRCPTVLGWALRDNFEPFFMETLFKASDTSLAVIGCILTCLAAWLLFRLEEHEDPIRRKRKAVVTFGAAIAGALISLSLFALKQLEEKDATEKAQIATKQAQTSDAENRNLQLEIKKLQQEILTKQTDIANQAKISDAKNRKLQIEIQTLQHEILAKQTGSAESISKLHGLLTEIKAQSSNCADCVSNLLPVLVIVTTGLTNSANAEARQEANDVLVMITQMQNDLNNSKPNSHGPGTSGPTPGTTNVAPSLDAPGGLHITPQ